MKVLTFHLCGGGGSLLSQISLSSSICCDENIGPTIFSDLGCQLVVIVYPFFNKRVNFKKCSIFSELLYNYGVLRWVWSPYQKNIKGLFKRADENRLK